jgi:putative transcriptional regulator
MTNRYKSDITRAVHRAARDSHRAGVMDKRTMREFDMLCLSSVSDLTADEIRAIRDRAGVSQSVFAAYLNVTTNLVSKWERGEKRPGGAAKKLLSIVKTKGLEVLA